MKNYITAEEFLKQSEKVQKELLEWWENNLNEVTLVGYTGKNKYYKNSFPTTVNRIALDCMEIGKEIIPLLQIHQLIQFIEYKTGGKLDFKYYFSIGYEICIYKNNIKELYRKFKKEKYLLQALWKVAIEIIEDGE